MSILKQKLENMTFSTAFLWVFLVGNIVLGFVHQPFFQLAKSIHLPIMWKIFIFGFNAPYIIGSLLLLYTKRKKAVSISSKKIIAFIWAYVALSILTFYLVGSFSFIQFIGVIIYEMLLGHGASWILVALNPKYY